ncbi:MAG: tRNA (adenosine(37)-N6)-dimethylallyltransferase MiaA [Bacteroidota bacterium]|nr:tRNA (adenosine(37)-N6)-dimethylallyltransferase MiaA [Bacteroidota bacterium]
MAAPAGTPRIRVIAGPTAVGKTSYSLLLAARRPAEIISADSRQIYRQLTIGTAKPSPAELASVPHHFIDELDVGAPFSAGMFVDQANNRIAAILSRGHEPIVVGGATLYLRALIHGLSPVVPSDPTTRAEIEAQLAADGPQQLYQELLEVDPNAASTMDPTKTARVMRALEVYRITGTPLSAYHAIPPQPAYEFDVTILTLPRQKLYERINRRTDQMLKAGLLDEVRDLHSTNPELPLLQTIGYQEAMAHLAGSIPHVEMVRLIKRNTRRYAKRQLTWFRRYPEYRWMEETDLRRSQAAPHTAHS